jgi:murein DD-endopeptidase MepM/ murein hydrolase activator NlpD
MELPFKKCLRLATVALLLLGGQLAAAWAADIHFADQTNGMLLSTPKIINGNSLLLQIDTRKLKPPIKAMGLIFQQREFPVYKHPLNRAHYRFGLIGIPYRQTPGPSKLTLKWTNAAGKHVKTIPFEIITGKYRTDVLKVDSARVNPSQKNIKRAQKEARKVKQTYADGNIAGLWKGNFQFPMASEITSPFGNRRLFNGQLKSYHNGVDFRAPIGTPVFATNSGVEKGQQLGLTGATGRVSGPHLHWGVKVNGAAVNPIQFVKLMGSLVREPE